MLVIKFANKAAIRLDQISSVSIKDVSNMRFELNVSLIGNSNHIVFIYTERQQAEDDMRVIADQMESLNL